MADANAVAVNFVGRDSGFSGAIRGVVGSLGKFSGALKLGAAAALFFGQKALRAALSEAIRFQTEMANLQKVMEGVDAGPVAESIARMSAEMPIARARLMEVGATAARLGIRGKANILEFTRVMGMIGTATDLSAEMAAENMARIAEITNFPIKNIQKLASVGNELSNTMATSFSEIIRGAGVLAKALAVLDVPAEKIFAIAAAVNEVNISISKGARQVTSFINQLSQLDKIPKLAAILEITPDEFLQMIETDVIGAIQDLIAKFNEGGTAALKMKNIFDSAAVKGLGSLAQNADGLADALVEVEKEMRENNSLTREYEIFAGTAASKSIMLTNKIDELQRKMGEDLRPAWEKILELGAKTINMFNRLFNLFDDVDLVFGKQIQEDIEEGVKGAIDFATHQQDILRRAFAQGAIGGLAIDIAKLFGRSYEDSQRKILEFAAGLAGVLKTDQAVAKFVDRMKEGFEEWEGARLNAEQIEDRIREIFLSEIVAFDELTLKAQQAKDKLKKEPGTIPGGEGAFAKFLAGFDPKRLREALDIAGISEDAADLNEKVINLAIGLAENIIKMEQSELAAKMWRAELEKSDPSLVAIQHNLDEFNAGLEAQEEAHKAAQAAAQGYLQSILIETIRHKDGEEAARKFELRLEGITGATAAAIVAGELRIKQWEDEAKAIEKADKEAARLLKRLQKKFDDLGLKTLESRLRLLERVIGDLADAMVDTFEALVTGADSAGDAVVKMLRDIARALATAGLQSLIFQLISAGLSFGAGAAAGGGGGGGSFGGGRTGVGGFNFAAGGKMSAGRMGIVGEQGPEMFVPDVDGTIVPNSQLGGKVVQINVKNHFTIQALDGASVRDILMREQTFIAHNTVKQIRRSDLFKQAIR